MKKTLTLIAVILVAALMQASAQKTYGVRMLEETLSRWNSGTWERLDSTRMYYKDTNSVMKLDTTTIWRYDSLTTYIKYGLYPTRIRRTYDATNQLKMDDGYIDNSHIRTYWYYKAGKVDSVVTEYENNGTWIYSRLRRYDTQGRILIDSFKSQNKKYEYTGNLITAYYYSQGNSVDTTIYLYDAQNRLVKDSIDNMVNEYHYNSNGQLVAIAYGFWDNFTSTYEVQHTDSLRYNAKGNLATDTKYTYSISYQKFFPQWRVSYEYDSLNNVITYYEHAWTHFTQKFDEPLTKRTYVYERFLKWDPTIHVAETHRPEGAIKIYPNPATSSINIAIDNIPASNKLISFSIYNAAGMLVKRWYEPAVGAYSKTVDVSALEAGNYILRCNASPGDVQQFTITK
jgi:hypothetical protein